MISYHHVELWCVKPTLVGISGWCAIWLYQISGMLAVYRSLPNWMLSSCYNWFKRRGVTNFHVGYFGHRHRNGVKWWLHQPAIAYCWVLWIPHDDVCHLCWVSLLKISPNTRRLCRVYWCVESHEICAEGGRTMFILTWPDRLPAVLNWLSWLNCLMRRYRAGRCFGTILLTSEASVFDNAHRYWR